MTKPYCLVVPVYGRPHFTRQLLEDLRPERHLADVLVVDNGGDFESDEAAVLRPGRNLGWLGGTNVGLAEAARGGHEFLLCCNNDVRLSPGFLAGLLPAARRPDCGVFAPAYRGPHPHQRPAGGYQGPASGYAPVAVTRSVGFVDGTCFGFTPETLAAVGGLDPLFEPLGWGADQDFCIRVRAAGKAVLVAESAYLEHLVGGTAVGEMGGAYFERAGADHVRKMEAKYGAGYERLL